MATAAQIQANRTNARKSTGPRTAEGKEKASQNALKHGLRARQAVIPGEDPGEFEEHREEMLAELAPAGAVQGMLAERIVHLSWRLKRAERVQNAVFDTLYAREVDYRPSRRSAPPAGSSAPPAGSSAPANPVGDWVLGRTIIADYANRPVLDRLLTYERRIESSLYKAMRELERLKRLHELAPPTTNPTPQSQSQPEPAMPPEEPTPEPASPPGQSPARPQAATLVEQPTPEPDSPSGDETLRQTKPIAAGETRAIADCQLRIGDSQASLPEEPQQEMPNEANLVTAEIHRADAESTEMDAATALKSS